MKRFLFVLVLLFGFILPVKAQQVLSATSASAEQHADGKYYLVLSGDQGFINRACSFGDCSQGFNSRIDALNYWALLMGKSLGLNIVPIPAAPAAVQSGGAAQPPFVPPADYPCGKKPCIPPPPPGHHGYPGPRATET